MGVAFTPMNAKVGPQWLLAEKIAIEPLKKPTYTSTRGIKPDTWITENIRDLRSWYEETGGELPESRPQDFKDFCEVQFDLQQVEDGYWLDYDQQADRDDESYEAWHSRQP